MGVDSRREVGRRSKPVPDRDRCVWSITGWQRGDHSGVIWTCLGHRPGIRSRCHTWIHCIGNGYGLWLVGPVKGRQPEHQHKFVVWRLTSVQIWKHVSITQFNITSLDWLLESIEEKQFCHYDWGPLEVYRLPTVIVQVLYLDHQRITPLSHLS